MAWHFPAIGVVHSCFRDKFGIPRQAGLVPAAEAELELLPPYDHPAALRGLEEFSHVWLVFVFHQQRRGAWKPSVRPPRLGGNQRLGTYATRSPFRPNRIGISAVELRGIRTRRHRRVLLLGGVDLLDGTPVLDVKPYLPYADSIPTATAGFASSPPGQPLRVVFLAQAQQMLAGQPSTETQRLRELITQVLRQDPRPAYLIDSAERRVFGMRLEDLNIRWRIEEDQAQVIEITPWAKR